MTVFHGRTFTGYSRGVRRGLCWEGVDGQPLRGSDEIDDGKRIEGVDVFVPERWG
jgi:hypothetical protein